jgi:4-amino-4-deoxy-L-arabinose transferase-like glycosyltransferase
MLRLLSGAGLAVAAVVSIFYNLGVGPLADWDEAIYAEVSRELLWSHNWVLLYWNYTPWFDKPPLTFWLTAILYSVIGVTELSARLVAAGLGLGAVLLTYLVGRHLRDHWTGLLAAGLLLLCIQFLAASRFGITDAPLACFIWLAIYCYLRSEADGRWWYGVGLGVGLALMTKGAAGLVAPAAIAIALLLDRRWSSLQRRDLLLGVALACLVALPWHLVSYLQYGRMFLDNYIGYTVITRASQSVEGHRGSALTYLAYMRNQYFPWFYLVPFGLIAHVLDLRRGRIRSWVVIVLAAVVFTVYTVAASKWIWYMVPLYPALALILAGLLRDAAGEHRRLALTGVVIAGGLAVFWIPASLHSYQRIWAVPFAGLAATAAIVAASVRRPWQPAVVAVVAAFLAAVSFNYLLPLYPAVRPAFVAPARAPVVPLAVQARAPSADQVDPIGVLADGTSDLLPDAVWPDVVFYTRRPMRSLHSVEDVRSFAADGKPHDLIAAGADTPMLEKEFRFQVRGRSGDYVYGTVQLRS